MIMMGEKVEDQEDIGADHQEADLREEELGHLRGEELGHREIERPKGDMKEVMTGTGESM